MRSNESVVSLTSNETAIKIYQGFIDPYFIYWLPVWDGLGSTLDIFLITICLFFYLFKACRGYFPLCTVAFFCVQEKENIWYIQCDAVTVVNSLHMQGNPT